MKPRELVQQMLASLKAADAIICDEFGGTTCPELHTCDEAILAARAYLAAPEQSEPVDFGGNNHPITLHGWQAVLKEGGGTVLVPITQQIPRLKPTPQPTTPEPVNQMLLEALKRALEAIVNEPHATPNLVNAGRTVDAAIDLAEQAPQPTIPADDAQGVELTELLQEAASNCQASIVEAGISDSRRVYRTELHHRLLQAIAAQAQKGKAK